MGDHSSSIMEEKGILRSKQLQRRNPNTIYEAARDPEEETSRVQQRRGIHH